MQGGKRREPAAPPEKGRRTRKEAPGEAGAEAGKLRPTRGKQRPGGAARGWGRGVALAQRLHRAGVQPSAVLGGCGLSLGSGPALRPRRRRSRGHGTRSARRSLPGARRATGAEPARPPPPSATTAPPTADSALASPRPFRRADRPSCQVPKSSTAIGCPWAGRIRSWGHHGDDCTYPLTRPFSLLPHPFRQRPRPYHVP